jgi:hypothetical protein
VCRRWCHAETSTRSICVSISLRPREYIRRTRRSGMHARRVLRIPECTARVESMWLLRTSTAGRRTDAVISSPHSFVSGLGCGIGGAATVPVFLCCGDDDTEGDGCSKVRDNEPPPTVLRVRIYLNPLRSWRKKCPSTCTSTAQK